MTGNNFKELLPFNHKGVELKTWLDTHKTQLNNQRIFYILKANMESKDIFKIGLSERGGQSAYGRLNDYYHFYGKSAQGGCYGVSLHLVLANTWNPDVQNSDARVRRVETKMKAHFKDVERRGSERFAVSIGQLFKYMTDNNLLQEEEIEKSVRRTSRFAEKGQGAQDAVKSIVSHTTTRRGVVKYEVEFHEAFVYDKNQVGTKKKMPNKVLTYDELVGMRHGKKTVDEYNDKHLFK